MNQTIGYLNYKLLLDLFISSVQAELGNNIVSIILYGSVARGEARPGSDVDLLIILRDASPVYRERLQQFLVILCQLQEEALWKEPMPMGYKQKGRCRWVK